MIDNYGMQLKNENRWADWVWSHAVREGSPVGASRLSWKHL